jgi:Cu(I)/Ag(I) efflux system periplasmic protein CusF
MYVRAFKPALMSLMAAFAASLCCLLPLAVIVLGLGSGAFMATTMRYQGILLPLGILGVSAGYILYFRERRRCQALVCTMAGSRVNLIALGLATAVLLGEVVLVAFPEGPSRLFTQAMVSAAKQIEHFDAEGTIVSIDSAKHLLTIKHGDIKGLMSPMTMAFPVASPALVTRIGPGDRVRFTLERSPQGLSIVALTKEASPGEARVILDVEGMV